MCSRRASHTGIASDKSMARVQRTLVSLAGRAVPSRRIIANPAVADMHAVDKRVSKGPAALNDTSAHGSNIGL